MVARIERLAWPEANSDDTRDVRPKLYNNVIGQVKLRLKDYAALKHPGESGNAYVCSGLPGMHF